jgi:hypothetical protein
VPGSDVSLKAKKVNCWTVRLAGATVGRHRDLMREIAIKLSLAQLAFAGHIVSLSGKTFR